MRVAFSLLAFLPAVIGCAGSVSASGESGDAEAQTTRAVVVVARSTNAVDGAVAEASARFIRVAASSSPEDALRVVGAALDLPAPGTCSTTSSLVGVSATEATPVVELVDVGAVTLEANGIGTRLAPRQLPDVTDLVTGIVYARAADAVFLPASSTYIVHVGGGPNLNGFDISAMAPGDPNDVRISGSLDVEAEQPHVVASGASVDFGWTPNRDDDVIYVDVRPNGIRCVFDNSGHGEVSTSFLDDTGTLVVHRLHREALHAPGIDGGELRFDFARSVDYSRR